MFMCGCVYVIVRVCEMCVYLPLGGGLMSVSPCWLELSDCPDSAKEEKHRVVNI